MCRYTWQINRGLKTRILLNVTFRILYDQPIRFVLMQIFPSRWLFTNALFLCRHRPVRAKKLANKHVRDVRTANRCSTRCIECPSWRSIAHYCTVTSRENYALYCERYYVYSATECRDCAAVVFVEKLHVAFVQRTQIQALNVLRKSTWENSCVTLL